MVSTSRTSAASPRGRNGASARRRGGAKSLLAAGAILLTAAGIGSAAVPVPQEKPAAGGPEARRTAGPRRAGEPQRTASEQRPLLQRLFGQRGAKAPGGPTGGARRSLLQAYPGAFSFEANHLVFPSGERVVWDDGREKSASDLLTDADVQDMFHYPYPRARLGPLEPPRGHDPGRVRSEAFLRALYGSNAREVEASIVAVPWLPALGGGTIRVTRRFGVDRALAAVSEELQRLPARYHTYLVPPAGGFVWRPIAGTNRLSVHSFGAAVDIATRHASYWRWDGQAAAGAAIPYRNAIPLEIVEVFERHCFIWGGRWYHYDTMHFEYRPELLPGCRRPD